MMHHVRADDATLKSFFANRLVQCIFLSNVFLQTGIWVRNFAVLLFVAEQTHKNPVAVSMISVAEFGPIFLFAFIGGAFADRWKPKRTMVLCDLLSALSVFLVLLALNYAGWQAIFFATLVSSILSQFSQPSTMKLFKRYVPQSQMQLGMSVHQTVVAIFTILGPTLGTFVYFRFGINTSVTIMGICFALSAAVLTFAPSDEWVERSGTKNLFQEMKLGLHYVLSNRVFSYMGGFFLAAGLALGLINPLGIYLVTEHLGLTADHLQWFAITNGVGMILGSVVAMAVAKRTSPLALMLFSFILSAVSVATLGSVRLVWFALIAVFVSGLTVPLFQIPCNALILNHADEAFVGRVNGILNPLFIGGMVLNMSLVGVLKQQLSLSSIYLLAAGLFAIGAIAMVPMFRLKLERPARVSHHFHH
jgi:MFS transporter, DHA3 family, macrolide efflux protein